MHTNTNSLDVTNANDITADNFMIADVSIDQTDRKAGKGISNRLNTNLNDASKRSSQGLNAHNRETEEDENNIVLY